MRLIGRSGKQKKKKETNRKFSSYVCILCIYVVCNFFFKKLKIYSHRTRGSPDVRTINRHRYHCSEVLKIQATYTRMYIHVYICTRKYLRVCTYAYGIYIKGDHRETQQHNWTFFDYATFRPKYITFINLAIKKKKKEEEEETENDYCNYFACVRARARSD